MPNANNRKVSIIRNCYSTKISQKVEAFLIFKNPLQILIDQ